MPGRGVRGGRGWRGPRGGWLEQFRLSFVVAAF